MSDRSPDRRKLIAVLHMDMVGYSRLIGLDDAGTLKRLRAVRKDLIDPATEEHGGRLVNTGGDSLLLVFDSIDGAVRCAVKVQQEVPGYDADQPFDRTIRFRVGINIGDVIPDGTDVHGDVVNVAARLQAECPPGGICVSRQVRDHIHGRLGLDFEELGTLNLKNIAQPVEAFLVRPNPTTKGMPIERVLMHATGEALPLPDKPSIAVLPFANLSADPEQEYFSDGVADDIITELSRDRSLFVIARNSSFTYRERSVDVKRVGRELGVRYVVEGSVRRHADRVRVTAKLIDAIAGNHVWAQRYDRDLADVFAVQDEITTSVVTAIVPAVADAELGRILRKPVRSLGAWEAYQRGLWHYARPNPTNFKHARDFFGLAIKMDPSFASPYYRLALLLLAETGLYRVRSVQETTALAQPLSQRAIELDPDDADALAVAASVCFWAGEWNAAFAWAEQAVKTNPNSVNAHRVRGFSLMNHGRPAEARDEYLTCLRIDSRDTTNWLIRNQLGMSYFYESNYQAAVETLELASRLSPHYPEVQFSLAAALGQLGRSSEAQQALERAMRLLPANSDARLPTIVPRRRHEDLERFLDGLRKAGWQG
jgi:adenylate cyclase